MTQKVLKVGTSAAVTLSKESLKELGLRIGDEIRIEVDRKRKIARIEPVSPKPEVDSELIAWTDAFIDRYRDTLEALARK